DAVVDGWHRHRRCDARKGRGAKDGFGPVVTRTARELSIRNPARPAHTSAGRCESLIASRGLLRCAYFERRMRQRRLGAEVLTPFRHARLNATPGPPIVGFQVGHGYLEPHNQVRTPFGVRPAAA